MNNSTTSISDLPSDPTGGGISSGNISMSIQENDQQMQAQMLPPSQQLQQANQNHGNGNGNGNGFSLDQTTINQIARWSEVKIFISSYRLSQHYRYCSLICIINLVVFNE